MDFQTSVKTCLIKKYLSFNGRASRSELWYFTLFIFIFYLAIPLLGIMAPPNFVSIVSFLFGIAILMPSIAVWVRRLHDINKGGAWFLITCIPLIGCVFAIIWGCTAGTPGENRFGSQPL